MSARLFPTGDEFFRDLHVEVWNAIAVVSQWPEDRQIREGIRLGDLIAHNFDAVYATKRPHRDEVQPEEIHEAVAYGIALGATRPGGVTILGLHACVDAHPDCPGRAA
jgi:hypothetical protein